MAKYNAIKAAVNAYIRENGRKEITGKILNAVLNATIDSLGRFFQFSGGALPTDDPGTPDQNVCYLAGEPGVYTHFGNITIGNEEVALLLWDGEWKKESVLYGIQEVEASVDNQVGTPSVDVSYSEGRLVLTFHNIKGEQGETGESAGFGTIGADVDNNHGTPGVSVETSGDNTAKNIMFHFTNLKGETGVTSVVATIDDTSGTPSCQVSLADGVLTLAFSGLKGVKGDTGVSADYPITIYNGLDSDATDQALAAAQGKVLQGEITRLELEVREDFVSAIVCPSLTILSNNSVSFSSVTIFDKDGIQHVYYANDNHDEVTFTFGSGKYWLVIKSSGEIIQRGNASYVQSDDIILLVYSSTNSIFAAGLLLPVLNANVVKGVKTDMSAKQDLAEEKTIVPGVEIGRISNTGIMTEMLASTGSTNVVYINKTYWRTPNFISIDGMSSYSLKASRGIYVLPVYYDKNFNWIGSGSPPISSGTFNYTALTSNTHKTFSNYPNTAKYVKFCFRSSAGTSGLTAINNFDFEIKGHFKENWEVKNVASIDVEDYGAYQTLATLVNVTDPNCCDTLTNVVQDSVNLKYDYGVLALPLQYTNQGKPTRLIIYCHGAGAHYQLTSKRFQSMDARLWLSEGYAVLDIEANTYNDTDDHGYIPAAMETYVSAYNWIVKHYNIRKDGVLLAGKSMGGGETFDLMASSIPIIASCAIVPVCNYIWWWTYMNANRRTFVAQKLGFSGTAPIWTGNSPMSADEWQYLQDNYEKFIKYDPFGRLITNPPTKNELFTGMNLPASTATPTEGETALWENRVAKVPCPVKIFIGQDDTTVPPQRNGAFMYKMLLNGSNIVEYRQFATGGHHIEDPTRTGHGQDVVNSYGVTITDAPVVFAEILNFWRRYEENY